MKIGNNATSPAMAPAGGAATTSARPAEAGRPASGVSKTQSEGSTTVQLSKTAQTLMAADGSFDAEKVSRVRQSISDGTYKINAEAIADKLITNAQEVLGRSGSAS